MGSNEMILRENITQGQFKQPYVNIIFMKEPFQLRHTLREEGQTALRVVFDGVGIKVAACLPASEGLLVTGADGFLSPNIVAA